MKKITYTPKGVCPIQLSFTLDGDVVTDVAFVGGCNGNLKAIGKLVDGMTVAEIEEKLLGNTCGNKPTSCADQLARAVREAYDAQNA
ncbi:MAG: TIGR03905 family TSCPD domain-containing protein [Oscillospiraceae bacterium]|nr:TIGR03905 family TSCPD domain-containing protein [Oscillospiraceae bacterium]